jgi:hypothetical protein
MCASSHSRCPIIRDLSLFVCRNNINLKHVRDLLISSLMKICRIDVRNGGNYGLGIILMIIANFS